VAVVRAVAADPDDALAVDGDAVVALGPLEAGARAAGAAPRVDHVAVLIELEHGRRRRAAVRRRRRRLGVLLLAVERRAAAMDDPDVVVGVDADADGAAHAPVVRQRLGPHRIDFEARRLHRGLAFRVGGALEERLTGRQEGRENHEGRADVDVAVPLLNWHHCLPLRMAEYNVG